MGCVLGLAKIYIALAIIVRCFLLHAIVCFSPLTIGCCNEMSSTSGYIRI